jgi:hypothetical protein
MGGETTEFVGVAGFCYVVNQRNGSKGLNAFKLSHQLVHFKSWRRETKAVTLYKEMLQW